MPTNIHALVEQLPPFDRELIRLAAFDELSYEEMAIVLGCRTSHVRTRLHRARERLRRMQDASLTAATRGD
jgi:RNA polymerase sigma-70 factor (ECF subfamily)